MIKKTVVCDRCHDAEAKYYTNKRMDPVYCEKCVMEILNAQNDCIRCAQCASRLPNTGIIERQGLYYCSVECLVKDFYGASSSGELNDAQREILIANG